MNTLALPNEAEAVSVPTYIHRRGDIEEFHALPNTPRDNKPGVFDEVHMNVEAMLRIDALISAGHGKVEARRHVAQLYRGQPGMRISSLNIKHAAWIKGARRGKQWFQPRDWRYFIPQYSNGEVDAMIRNRDFCQYLALLVGDTDREDTGLAVKRLLLEQWQAGQPIPGVGTISQWCARQSPPRAVPARHQQIRPEDCPAGWSEWNLARCVKTILGPAGSAKRTYLQRGEHAAMSHWADQLYRSRANLNPLELITCDDVDLDLYVWMPDGHAHGQIVRPKCLFVMDVATGSILNFGIVGAYTRRYYTEGGDADTKRGIQTGDMKHLLLATLSDYGMPQNWRMHFLHENAAAKLTEHDARLFQRWLPIDFANTQMMKTKLPGGFMESCGNPKQKGWIESWFRLLHTSLNHVPGTIGRRYDLSRGDTGGAITKNGKQYASRRDTRIGETLAILREAGQLALERGCPITELLDSGAPGHADLRIGANAAPRFRLPLLHLDQLEDLLHCYVQKINARTDHALEGFEEVFDIEVRPGEFLPDYHPVAQQLARPGMRGRCRLESPAERFHRLTRGQPFRQPTPRELLVLARETKPITIRNEQVTITPRGHHTPVRFRDQESAEALAKYNSKDKALVYFLSPSGDQVHLFTNDAALDYVASPRRVDAPDIMDERAMGKRMGEVHRGREQIRAETADIMAPRAQEIADMREHNSTVAATSRSLSSSPADRTANAIQGAENRATTDRQRAAEERRALAKITDEDIDSVLDQDEPVPSPAAHLPDLDDAF